MNKTYKYRIYPNREQIRKLNFVLEECCFLYNCALRGRIEAWKHNVSLNSYSQSRELTECRRLFPELSEIHRVILADVLRRLDRAYQNFFRRVRNGETPGFPRFKNKNRYHSFTYSSAKNPFRDGKLELSKIGFVKIKMSRPLPDDEHTRTLTITKEGNKWYACFGIVVDTPPLVELTSESKVVGIDVGIESFATLSTGQTFENPRWYRYMQKQLRHQQKSLSKKKRGSKNRKKQVLKVARVHEKTRNKRKDYHHKLSRELVNEFDLIAFEDLEINKMVKNKYFAKSIHDAGWGQFKGFVCYKAEEAGKQTVNVDPSSTSIECSRCGFPVLKTLSDRIHNCPNCKLIMPRDQNSALVILHRALPQELRNFKPVEISVRMSMKQEVGVFGL